MNCFSTPDRIGRDGRLDLTFRSVSGRTILTGRRFTLPLQALEPLRNDDDSLYLLLLNPTGGILGGDCLVTRISLGPDSHAILGTPSATKIYRTDGDPAVASTKITIADGAILEYLPDHLIPHPQSAFRQSHEIEIGTASRAIIYEAFCAGRIGRGEKWQFRTLINETRVTRARRPIYINRSELIPGRNVLSGAGWIEDFNYAGSLVVLADSNFAEWDGLATAMIAVIDSAGDAGVMGGVTRIESGCVARFLTMTANDLNRTAYSLWSKARNILLGLPAFEMRKQ